MFDENDAKNVYQSLRNLRRWQLIMLDPEFIRSLVTHDNNGHIKLSEVIQVVPLDGYPSGAKFSHFIRDAIKEVLNIGILGEPVVTKDNKKFSCSKLSPESLVGKIMREFLPATPDVELFSEVMLALVMNKCLGLQLQLKKYLPAGQ